MDTMQRLSTASWSFKLPKEWTKAGDIYLEAEILPPTGLECYGYNDAANRIRVSKVTFNQVPNFSQNLVHLVIGYGADCCIVEDPLGEYPFHPEYL
jgi:hypothetical protein